MDLHLEGRRALVTGASKGIGRATAAALAEEGCDVTLVARNDADVKRAVAEIAASARGAISGIAADLSTEAGRQELLGRIGDIDILVNCAGAIPGGGITAISDDVWRRAWELKVFGFISLCRHIYPTMTARGSGVIVNIIGAAGERPDPGYIAGSTGNAGLIAFTRALGQEAPKFGVRVVGVNPGFTLTDRALVLLRVKAEQELGDAGRWQEYQSQLPFGRAAKPEEISATVAFLASDRSAYTSGVVLTINGGG